MTRMAHRPRSARFARYRAALSWLDVFETAAFAVNNARSIDAEEGLHIVKGPPNAPLGPRIEALYDRAFERALDAWHELDPDQQGVALGTGQSIDIHLSWPRLTARGPQDVRVRRYRLFPRGQDRDAPTPPIF